MVFLNVQAVAADHPAANRLIGRSPSSKCPFPCRYCDILSENLRAAILDASKRGTNWDQGVENLDEEQRHIPYKIFAARSGRSGIPVDLGLRAVMWSEYGLKRVTELAFWNNIDLSCSTVLIDLMHLFCLGICMKVLSYTVRVLTCKHPSKGGVAVDGATKQSTKQTAKTAMLWKHLSNKFSAYCQKVGVSCFSRFDSEESLKSHKTASTMKELMKVAPHILLHAVPAEICNEEAKTASMKKKKKEVDFKRTCFSYFCMYCKVVTMLLDKQVTVGELRAARTQMEQLLKYWVVHCPHIITINAHTLTHLIPLFYKYGPAWIWANFCREG